MKIGAVKAVVFSPTDNTKIIADRLAEEIAGRLKVPFRNDRLDAAEVQTGPLSVCRG